MHTPPASAMTVRDAVPVPGPGRPTAFSGCAGVLHPATGGTAILMVGSWGFEALCLAGARRALADRFAAAGYPTLRYDHPGTGDSLDDPPADLSRWQSVLTDAAAHLMGLSGADRLVIVADGLGAALALRAASALPALAGLVLLAPVVSGRAHLREVQALSGMIDGGRADPGVIAGLRLPEAVVRDLSGLDLTDGTVRVSRALVVARPGRMPEKALADRIETDRGPADRIGFDDYADAVSDPTRAVHPTATWSGVLAWLGDAVPAGRARPLDRQLPAIPSALIGAGFREEGCRFGPDERLFGILARPAGPLAGPAVILANAGRDPHVGWARFGVELSRRLARAGVPVLRLDLSGIGESPAPAGREHDELLYSAVHQQDLVAAAAYLAGVGLPDVVLAGRCSGAYAGLHAAPSIPSARAVVAINLLRVIWDPREDVATAVTADIRPIGDVARQALNPGTVLRILKGEIDPRNLMRRIVAKAGDAVAARSPAAARRRRAAAALLEGLGSRGTRVAFLSGENDVGLSVIARTFGSLDRLAAMEGVTLTLIPDTDHNLTPAAARTAVAEAFIRFLTCGSE